MKKVFLLAGMLALCTSCTYEDVVNYLSGKENNLTKEQKEEVDSNKLLENSTNEIDPDKVKPPTHG